MTMLSRCPYGSLLTERTCASCSKQMPGETTNLSAEGFERGTSRVPGAILRSASVRIPGLVVTEHELSVPLDHDDPARGTITLFAREVADPDGTDKPFLLFLQGGPGHESPRPADRRSIPWLERALKDFRV